MRQAKSAGSPKHAVRGFTQSHITTNSVHADREREIAMEFHIELYNTASAIAWALVVFLLGGIAITRKK